MINNEIKSRLDKSKQVHVQKAERWHTIKTSSQACLCL